MRQLNLQVMVQANGVVGRSPAAALDAICARAVQRPDGGVHERQLAQRRSRDSARRAPQQLEADIKAGALGLGEICKDLGMHDQQARRHAGCSSTIPSSIRSGRRRAAEDPGVHSHRRAAGVLRAARLQQRALARTGALSATAATRTAFRFEELMAERDRMVAQHPKTTFILAHMGWHANDLARARQDVRHESERLQRGRRGALRHRPAAASRARVLRQVPGSDSVRQGQLPARRISVLLARFRDQRRIFRLLPRLSRLLEAVRHRSAGPGAEEALLRERVEAGARACRKAAFHGASFGQHGYC